MKFRVWDTIATIASVSIEAFQLSEKNGFLQDIIAAISIDDILQKLNVIELLEKVPPHSITVSPLLSLSSLNVLYALPPSLHLSLSLSLSLSLRSIPPPSLSCCLLRALPYR